MAHGPANLRDITDRAARLLGVVYGSQGAQLKQRAATLELLVQLVHAGVEYQAGGGAAAAEPATFYVRVDAVANAVNKYMATLFNTSATRKVVLQRLFAFQWTTTAVTGTGNEQRLVYINARTAGAVVTPFAADESDILSAGITADTASTAVTEVRDIRRFHLGNEEAKFATAAQAFNSDTIGWVDFFGIAGRCVWEKKAGVKGLTLRQNRGLSVKNVSGAVGSSSYLFEFTDEAV
jgi:hypothetical protein